jgi:hypothetical protein
VPDRAANRQGQYRVESHAFDVILTAFVVRFTQALQLAQAEAGVIAINAFDVVGDLRRHDSPFGQAHGA